MCHSSYPKNVSTKNQKLKILLVAISAVSCKVSLEAHFLFDKIKVQLFKSGKGVSAYAVLVSDDIFVKKRRKINNQIKKISSNYLVLLVLQRIFLLKCLCSLSFPYAQIKNKEGKESWCGMIHHAHGWQSQSKQFVFTKEQLLVSHLFSLAQYGWTR